MIREQPGAVANIVNLPYKEEIAGSIGRRSLLKFLPWEQARDRPKTVLLLQNAGALVAGLKVTGARMPHREWYYARLVAVYAARDTAAYRIPLDGYIETAREASRKAKRR